MIGAARRARRLAGRARRALRARRRPRWGNLRRQRPFSERYGFDRGTPVDRHHLDAFFAANGHHITGAVLEVKDPGFTRRFGREVTSVDLVDIDPRNAAATIVADLADAGSLPAGAFDCVVLPQTLQYVDDPVTAIGNAWASLRDGGVLLVTVPAVARLDPQLREVDKWRFTPAGLRTVLERGCPGAHVHVEAPGNLVTTTAFLHGLAIEELRARDIDPADPDHPLVVCGRARKVTST